MKKSSSDPKVKKTLVRNPEQKIRQPLQPRVARDLGLRVISSAPDKSTKNTTQKENDLNIPSVCSSEVLAGYLNEVKKTQPPPISSEDLNVNKDEISAKMTKKLNFHFNDRMYNNLIELNASIEDLKTRKDKKTISRTKTLKKDIEPNIEDFFEDDDVPDSPPEVPMIRPKFRPINISDDNELHKLVASFEDL